jgi:hypothetical protein
MARASTGFSISSTEVVGRIDRLTMIRLGHSGAVKYFRWGMAIGVLVLISACIPVGQMAGAASSAYPPFLIYPGDPCADVSGIPPIPDAQFGVVEAKVNALISQQWVGGGAGNCGHGLILAMLPVGEEALAKKLRAKFGPSVRFLVGDTVWDGRPEKSPLCGNLAKPTPGAPPFSMTLKLRSNRINAGADFRGHVELHNGGPKTLNLDSTGEVVMVITKPGTTRVVGFDTEPFALPQVGINIGPGQTTSMAAYGGTQRCDGGVGSALPPGRYDAVSEVSGAGIGIDLEGNPPQIYFTQSVPIRIVAAA